MAFCLTTTLQAADCFVPEALSVVLTPSTLQGTALRLGTYRVTVPPPAEIATMSDFAMLVYTDKRAIGYQSIRDREEKHDDSTVALFRKIYGLDALGDEDDRDAFDGLRESRCGAAARVVRYTLPEGQVAFAVDHGEWRQVMIFTAATVIDQLDFRHFSDAEIEAILGTFGTARRP